MKEAQEAKVGGAGRVGKKGVSKKGSKKVGGQAKKKGKTAAAASRGLRGRVVEYAQ